MDSPGEEEIQQATVTSWKNSTYEIISKVAYLIGVRKQIFEKEHEPPRLEIYEELDKQTNAKIVRELCRLRAAIERNFGHINKKIQYEYRTLMTLPEYIPLDAIQYLSGEGISVIKSKNRLLVDTIIELNRLICDRINNCRDLFPIWLDWQYVRDLFVMPDGLSVDGTKKAADLYHANKMKYPYQMYVNWIPDDSGNILFSDKKFVTLLYKQHGDEFADISKVSDAGSIIKNNIYEFINDSNKTVIVVDCENSDPYKLIATLNNLDRETVSKISKIFLYNDIHASSAWKLFESYAKNIEVEHIMIERVKENKSLVDIKLSTGVCREFYKNDVDSFIIASSDSDYWGLIDSLEDARFLVMVEYDKCGPDIKNALIGRGIFYCYIDDFCTGNSNDIKMAALITETKRYLAERIQLNVQVMLDEVYRVTRVTMSEAECQQFYNKYIKPMHLVIAENGDVSVELRGR
ncbi:MAG: hypothetical protein IJ493_13645 [Clostridia bacterium]|nr:hypothetical protein [Clostridia bacterium]